MEDRDIRAASIDIFTIYLIREQIQVVLLYEVTNLVHLPAGIEISCWVVRVTYHYSPCARVDKFLKLLYLWQRETLIDCCCYSANLGTSTDSKCYIIGIGWFWDDDFVTWIQARHEGEQYSLRATAGDNDIIWCHLDVIFVIISHQLFSQRLITL